MAPVPAGPAAAVPRPSAPVLPVAALPGRKELSALALPASVVEPRKQLARVI